MIIPSGLATWSTNLAAETKPIGIENVFQIVVPVYNEEKVLDTVLENAKTFEYLRYLVVANDASTDRTSEILDRWVRESGLRVVNLLENAKKEGAILAALEVLHEEGLLKPYTILLDADTRFQVSDFGLDVALQLRRAIEFLEHEGLGAMALRVNASYFSRPSPAFLSAYSTYFGLQFDCWLFGLLGQLWVINGAGGLFRTEQLLCILQKMTPSFETGDLQITVELMKNGGRLRLYDKIKALTYVPESAVELFNQRRRWERGTLKIMWKEKSFYLRQFSRLSLLPVAIMLHFALYVGVVLTLLGVLVNGLFGENLIQLFLISFLVWFAVDFFKGTWVALRTEPRRFPLFVLAAIVNGPVWLLVVIPARLFGGIEAVIHLIREHRAGNSKTIGASKS